MTNTVLERSPESARDRNYQPTQKDHEKFMRRAIKLSKRAALEECTGGAFGAVIVKDGKVVAQGQNRVVGNNDPTCHGEIEAIRKAAKKLKSFKLTGCTMYTSAEPCPMCMAAAYWAGIDRVYYAASCDDARQYGDFDDQFIYRELATPTDQRSIPIKQMLRDEAVDIWKQYQAKPDKVHY